jgi:Fe-S-cluster-containing dehydrogenase component
MEGKGMNRSDNPARGADVNRRAFFRALTGTIGSAALDQLTARPEMALAAIEDQAANLQARSGSPTGVELKALDVLERMRIELSRALAKPQAERRWVMVIDLRKCIGCHACTVGCIAENKLPPGVVYRPVLEEETGVYPNVGRRFIPRPCMQCDNPPCVPVCPVNATYTDADGIVAMDYDRCIGCRACIAACPYGARTADFGYTYTEGTPVAQGLTLGRLTADDYEHLPTHEYGRAREREGHASPVGNARKCHFCMHRVREGQLPACVTTCVGRATLFGDANDPDSLVAELIAKPNVMRLKEELGTRPRVFYLA